ncbi:D-alanyl-D-alanine carboxypeptidase family protein [Desulfitobacterium sp.]|uniref:D-alanyl-D-alanine carboxypeptidase family protein n=1 Tax=Desulfitobacterium sp. TaxID=49981 RepID=UPI002B1F04B2|nr:serine hydrolase [Desulfitobacterium sp.]MEA4902943.1 serine hydrolase [Desulfitobacterium sp.]
MKRKIHIGLSLILIIVLGISVIPLVHPSPSFAVLGTQSTSQSTFDAGLDSPSYYLINAQNQEVLLAQNEAIQRPPASTVKLLTGLVAMQTLKEDDVVKVGEEVNIENSTLGLKPGDTILVKDLLTALFLPSANDAAVALAVKAKGSVPAFVEAMNQYAHQLGCDSSNFQTPNGLPASDQYSTARDLAKIASEFIQNETLMKYVEKQEGKVEWTTSSGLKRSIIVHNLNEFLGIYPGVEGLKTGTTSEAGQCLVTYITRPDGNLILVLLGSKNRYHDTKNLLDQGMAIVRTKAALRNLGSSPESMVQASGFFQ